MKININAEVLGTEVVEQYILPQLYASKVEATSAEIKMLVFSEKKGEYVEFDVAKMKFVLNK